MCLCMYTLDFLFFFGQKRKAQTLHNPTPEIFLTPSSIFWQGAHTNSLSSSFCCMASFLLYCSSVADGMMSLPCCGCETHACIYPTSMASTLSKVGCCSSSCHNVFCAQVQCLRCDTLFLQRACAWKDQSRLIEFQQCLLICNCVCVFSKMFTTVVEPLTAFEIRKRL